MARRSWWNRLRGWQKVTLTLTTTILISLFVFFLYDILREQFSSPWQGLLVTGTLLLIIGAFTGWRYVMKKTRRKLG